MCSFLLYLSWLHGSALFHVGGVSTRTAVVLGLAAPVGQWDWASATRDVSAIMVLGTSR